MPSKISVIGLTGQSGAGKSTASAVFEKCGIPVIDCDKISHEVSEFSEFLIEFEKTFPGYTDENGLKRREFAALVFNDRDKMEKYEKIIFPLIKNEIFSHINELEASGEKLVILDAPTLFESGMDKICSAVVSVIAPLDIKIRRILERDGIPVELAQSRISSQNSEKWFYERSDWVIVNGGSFEDLEKKVEEIAEKIRERFDA